jgi:hypothetical protein
MGRQVFKMKNLFKIFSVCMLVFGSMAFGQTGRVGVTTPNGASPFDADTRYKLATMMATTRDNLSTVYASGESYESFRAKVLGRTGTCVTSEGETFLTKVYNYIKNGTSYDQIINSDSGVEMANALAKGNKIGYGQLFSNTVDIPKLIEIKENQHEAKGKGGPSYHIFDMGVAGCKWWQISCWIDDIFGAGTAAILIPIIIALI